MAITKSRIEPSFGGDGFIVDCYDWKGLSTDEKPTEGVAVNDLFLELDTLSFYYFDGNEWQPVGGAA